MHRLFLTAALFGLPVPVAGSARVASSDAAHEPPCPAPRGTLRDRLAEARSADGLRTGWDLVRRARERRDQETLETIVATAGAPGFSLPVRAAALEAHFEIGGEPAAELAHEVLARCEPGLLQVRALDHLSTLQGGPRTFREAVDRSRRLSPRAVHHALALAPDEASRIDLLEALAWQGREDLVESHVLALARDGSPADRTRIAQAIMDRLEVDREPLFSLAAVRYLGRVRWRPAVPLLIHLLNRVADDLFRAECARALGSIGDPQATLPLLMRLDSALPGLSPRIITTCGLFPPDPATEIIRALGAIGSPLAIPRLRRLAADEEAPMAGEARRALGEIGRRPGGFGFSEVSLYLPLSPSGRDGDALNGSR